MFTLAGRKFGASLVMQVSIAIGLLCVFILHWITVGQPLPVNADLKRWLLLGGSAVLGFWLSSLAILNAFILIGPRLALLIATSNPIMSAVLAWVFLGQSLALISIAGMLLIVLGIIYVITEGRGANSNITPEAFRLGITYAGGAACLQAVMQIMKAEGMAGDFNPISGNLMRLMVGAVVLWGLAVMRGDLISSFQQLRQSPAAMQQLSIGAVAGPVVGASLILMAFANAPVGVASILANLQPVFLIPIGYVVFKERITQRAIAGTFVAMFGAALLFM